ncbi:CoA pyrophosphatase [Lichenicoccus sp.]|uniref:CoA pyrophosphatase n=1 Tax=Lichenicoccus sp. TaxID=2781899 RepID=UPI003D136DD7
MRPACETGTAPPAPLDEAWLRQRLAALPPAAVPDWDTLLQRTPGSSRPHARLPRHAAVLVPIVPAPEPVVLLTRRSALLRHHSGQVSFPGGGLDPMDRDPAETALREAREEIGLDPATVGLLGRLPVQWTHASNFLITPVVGVLSAEARWLAAPAEVDIIFGMPLQQLLDPDAPRLIEGGLRHGSWSWPHPDHDIWGATAAILLRLARILREF